ncbi:hypothetical protein BKH46_00250 [Helicobacter sp. 12S02634-8]|uniref:DUF1090 domain-containing protein n=1 Tax=Helicobacter sp. 12S02634-8 TaxID=1476199 RepID=UPI000BA79DE0|nr:DUF1090 domain-containing protein [Helicobacter sp. 12S02634-8]PAF48381.1 hypothetical protein BKH46_00250 [Helicobacter sp. 12S02634-8]
MKKILSCGFVLGSVLGGVLLAGPICDFKAKDLQNQIDHANKNGQKHRVSELSHALKEVQDHCDDQKMLAKSKEKISQTEHKISEVKDKITALKAKGKTDKVREQEMKLKMLQTELEFYRKDYQEKQDLSSGNKVSPKP